MNKKILIPKGQLGLIAKAKNASKQINRFREMYETYIKGAIKNKENLSPKRLEELKQFVAKKELHAPDVAIRDPYNIYNPKSVEAPVSVKEQLKNVTFPRMKMHRPFDPEIGENFYYGDIYEFPEEAFKAAKQSGDGFYNSANNQIIVKANTNRKEDVIGHELRHRIDAKNPLQYGEQQLLDEAYGKDFTGIKIENFSPFYDYSVEIPTTNFDARAQLLDARNWYESDIMGQTQPQKPWYMYSIEKQNQMIDNAPDHVVVNAMQTANIYGRHFIQALKDAGKLTPERIKSIKEAMKYVGGYASPIVGYSVTKNKLIPKQNE